MTIEKFDPILLKQLYKPAKDSHKGQNGKLLVIGGSKLFHSASIWAAEVASRIVDMVFYSSIDENNEIVKGKFVNGIIVPRGKLKHYIEEADVILIGPGMPREEGVEVGDDDTKTLTENLLRKYPNKKWVIDGGSLQVVEPNLIPSNAILTPHIKEFSRLFNFQLSNSNDVILQVRNKASEMANKYTITILLKGQEDIVCSPGKCIGITGGNAGMTKGGTGDVLAGLVSGLYCRNNAFLAASSASFINKKAGERLFKRLGFYFNASDLALEIPSVMKELIY